MGTLLRSFLVRTTTGVNTEGPGQLVPDSSLLSRDRSLRQILENPNELKYVKTNNQKYYFCPISSYIKPDDCGEKQGDSPDCIDRVLGLRK